MKTQLGQSRQKIDFLNFNMVKICQDIIFEHILVAWNV